MTAAHHTSPPEGIEALGSRQGLPGRHPRARRRQPRASSPARSSACSAPTAPASRPRSRSCPPSRGRPRAAPRSPATTSSATRTASGAPSASSASAPRSTRPRPVARTSHLQGRLFGIEARELRTRIDGMFERFGLTEAADRIVGTWSGGMRRKLDVAMGLINRPRVLFLDEPTTGLDPEARAELWAEVGRALTRGRARDPAHHPLPRGGRPARRPARHRRPRPDRRRAARRRP